MFAALALSAGATGAQGVVPASSSAEPTPFPQQPTTEYDEFKQALASGRVWLNLNYRYEYVDDDDFSRSANANTLRTALGYETGEYYDFRFLIEFEDVTDITDGYNSTTNGKTGYPVVADPEGTEINQVYLRYDGMDESVFRLGRQAIALDNQRWVGNVPWRQNHQTYDAVTWTNYSLENGTAYLAYVDNVNRVFGEDSPVGDIETSTWLANVGYEFEGLGKLTGYWYDLDNDDQPNLSSSTFGGRFAGKYDFDEERALVYTAEYAQQTDTGDNPADLDQDYWLGELGGRMSGWTLLGGYEHLGGSGDPGDALQTPLATLFKFNGFADQFLTTPDTGLEDFYAKLTGSFRDFSFYVAYHVFESDSDGLEYGTEIDARITYQITDDLLAGMQGAHFNGDEGGFETVSKFWLYLTFAAL